MSREQVEKKLRTTRGMETIHGVSSLGFLACSAVFGIVAYNPSPGESRSAAVASSVIFGVIAGYNGMKSRSESMTAAQLEGVLAQDDLYTEVTPVQQELPTEQTLQVFDQEQP